MKSDAPPPWRETLESLASTTTVLVGELGTKLGETAKRASESEQAREWKQKAEEAAVQLEAHAQTLEPVVREAASQAIIDIRDAGRDLGKWLRDKRKT